MDWASKQVSKNGLPSKKQDSPASQLNLRNVCCLWAFRSLHDIKCHMLSFFK